MLKLLRRRADTAGIPAGELVHVGERKVEAARLTLIAYDGERFEERELSEPEECMPYLGEYAVVWLNVDGVHDVGLIERIGEQFGLHPLLREDVVHTIQRPRVDDYDGILYLVFKALEREGEEGQVTGEQISLVLGPEFLLSFQERPGDCFGLIRGRLRTGKGRLRGAGADFLAYSLLDAVVDDYFLILEELGDDIETLEVSVVEQPGLETLQAVHRLRREMILLRRSLWPLRAAVNLLGREEFPQISSGTRPYLRDVYDHITEALEYTETFRDLITGMLDVYLSSVGNRTNAIMKVLTVMATIFIPLTFMAGVWGMNFRHMPELGQTWGYPAALGSMAGVALGLLYYFRRKSWV